MSGPSLPGGPLNERDFANLAKSGISREMAERAMLRRVTSLDGGALVGRNGRGDYSGIVFQYTLPGASGIREYRLRRDHPEMEQGKEKNKYLSPPGARSMLYFPPGIVPADLEDTSIPIIVTEGEKKCLALAELPLQILAISISGVWNFRGNIGNVAGPNGERLDETGPIPDLDRIAWKARKVSILFDADVHLNQSVRWARELLAKELRRRGAAVSYIDMPAASGFKGVDDLIGGWGPERVVSLIRNDSYEPQQAWSEPIPFLDQVTPPFEPGQLPGFLGAMAEATAAATETPLELAGMLGLAVAAAAIAKKVIVSPEPGYTEPPNVYVSVAMESGNRKTSVHYKMVEPLISWEQSEQRRLQPEINRRLSERKSQEAHIEALRRKVARLPNPSAQYAEIAELEALLPTLLVPPQVWCQDVTPEKLGALMAEQDERMALLSEEGGIFDTLAGRYSSNGMANLDLILQAHAGAPVKVDRGNRPSLSLQNPALTLALAPQPDVLAGLSNKPGFRGRGLLARFLFVLPKSALGTRKLELVSIPEAIEREYKAGMERLLRLTPPVDETQASKPWLLTFSPSAYIAWKEFQRAVEKSMAEDGKLTYLKDWASKLPGAAARIAAILHCVEASPSADNTEIRKKTMDQALNLAALLMEHALVVFGMMGRDEKSEGAQKILDWIKRKGESSFKTRDCFHDLQHRFKTMDGIRPCLSVLEEHAYIRLQSQAGREGRPSEIYDINPSLLGGSA